MKSLPQLWLSCLGLVYMGLVFQACGPASEPTAEANLSVSQATPENAGTILDGGWYLVEGTYAGQKRAEAKPFQFKLFRDGQFAFLMQSEGGAWDYSSTGSYEIEGDIYRETFEFSTNAGFMGVTSEWKFELKGDSLFMEGPTKIINPDGQEAPELAGGYNTMQEVRVRAK